MCHAPHRGRGHQAPPGCFELADFVRVDRADLADGLLTIDLVREVPEAMKPKKIHVGGSASLSVVEGATKAA